MLQLAKDARFYFVKLTEALSSEHHETAQAVAQRFDTLQRCYTCVYQCKLSQH